EISLFSILLTLMLTLEGKAEPHFDATVAADGSGRFRTISEAISASPDHSLQKYYIKIKAGTYMERVYVGPEKTNIVLVGDGMGITVVTYNRSNRTGWDTINSATVGMEVIYRLILWMSSVYEKPNNNAFVYLQPDIVGNGFIAKYITFENSAGPENGQAVALRSISKFSTFYRCGFQGYQDTLYVQKEIQFYRECTIYGTIDFIFGNARVVFQNCDIYLHNPGKGRWNTVTAQGRTNYNDFTGISVINCTIKAATDFNSTLGTKTYLGRPWRPFATVVIMQSFLGDVIDLKGWHTWNDEASAPESVYYGEFQNRGPGAPIMQRVSWEKHKVMNSSEAEKFTVRNFINGDSWIAPTNIPFFLDFI
ncbi:hypothetical protein RJ640_014655, partial [Escallonia rubra]